jgi:beta-glucosidase
MTASDVTDSGEVARSFPDNFLWGVACSAYQIEGATHADGRGPSIWDTFSHTPGRVRRGDTGDIACDFYNRSDEDIELLDSLGAAAFRFSVAWPRIQPSGRGAVNQPGLDFYRSLIERLLAHNIEPALTLYHWDLPQALEDLGGWANRDTAERFADYAQIVAEGLGDFGGVWITVNEPQVSASHGYRTGEHAPGYTDDALAAAATHHLLLAHGLAMQRLRVALPQARLGITLDLHAVRAQDTDAEAAAAIADAEQNGLFLDPVLHGRYPERAREHILPPPSLIKDGDMELISAPIDFLGVNYYSPMYVKLSERGGAHADETPIDGLPGVVTYTPADLPRTSMGWLIEPDGLHDTLVAVAAQLPPGCRIYVTENGCAAEDYVNPEGTVEDVERVEYLHGHLAAAWNAIQEGVPLAGYFYWSVYDNFEWGWGYQKRFGLVYIEFESQRRIPKRSAAFYRQVMRANELPALDTQTHAWAAPR